MKSKVERVELEIGARMRGHRLPVALQGTPKKRLSQTPPLP